MLFLRYQFNWRQHKEKRSLTYPEVASVQKTIPHSDDLPKPNCSNAMATSNSSCQNSSESDMEAAYKKQHLIKILSYQNWMGSCSVQDYSNGIFSKSQQK